MRLRTYGANFTLISDILRECIYYEMLKVHASIVPTHVDPDRATAIEMRCIGVTFSQARESWWRKRVPRKREMGGIDARVVRGVLSIVLITVPSSLIDFSRSTEFGLNELQALNVIVTNEIVHWAENFF